MRLCHETKRGWISRLGGAIDLCKRIARVRIRTTWTWQGTEDFLGLAGARGRVSVPRKGKPQCLDPEG